MKEILISLLIIIPIGLILALPYYFLTRCGKNRDQCPPDKKK